ncbi:hypothetical protein [Azospirillum sp. TSA2s]|uniref:hypothetical protein n=1 Tax=Azospirillum sp. TSA2s TaxID=709810 RepID=UPI001FFF7151|nr:hypothetical protein [Azospirillum sp. TSA2s]
MTSALIGHTGFVGSNLDRPDRFQARFNSQNFREMAGQRFEQLVCAGISAVKWQANRDPEADRARIAALEAVLATVEADRVILISTVDVHPDLTGADEASDCHAADNHAYGRHRLAFEEFVRNRFPTVHILRLPGLFGPGLKKNVIFDLLHDNGLDAINPASAFQWYDVGRLWNDLGIAVEHGLPLVNLMTEPVETSTIVERVFPGTAIGAKAGPAVRYDVRTRHAALFGGSADGESGTGHIATAAQVLDAIGAYVASVRAGKA